MEERTLTSRQIDSRDAVRYAANEDTPYTGWVIDYYDSGQLWAEAAVILAVVLINVMVSFIQEGKAEKALEGIKEMLSLEASVVRDSERTTIDAEQLVPGDIVLLKAGDKVPADLRLIRSRICGPRSLR